MKKIKTIIFLLLLSLITLVSVPTTLNAASVTFKTTSSTSRVVVGRTFTVTVRVSSSEKLGSWEYTINYNSTVLSLVSGQKSVADPGNGSQTSVTYNYTFKAIKAGSSTISVKSYGALSWNEVNLSPIATGTTVTVITQAQLEASYSKDNNLKALTVDSVKLNPTFSAATTSYTAQLDPNVTSVKISATPNDRKASVSGTGTFPVTEGENKFTITVTAENGATKQYTVIANVVDPDPIAVTTTDGEELTVVKRKIALSIPDSYTETTVTINDQQIPALTSDVSKFTLVGLKNSEGKVNLYIYENNTYSKYTELKLNDLLLFPVSVKDDTLYGYKKSKITINNEEINAYKYKTDSNFAIIYAMNTETGEKNYYMYDAKNNTAILYNDEEIKDLNSKLKTYSYTIIGLLVESGILFIVLIILLIKKFKHNKLKKEKISKVKDKNKDDKKEIKEEEKKDKK